MKKILFILSIVLLSGASLYAQSPSGRAYLKGIYIFCGKEIPRNFYYSIEKKNGAGQWVEAAQLRAPQSAAALQANLLKLPASIRSTIPLPLDMCDYFWERQGKSFTTDSLFSYATDPMILAALGCSWFDDGLTAGQTCHYRISRVFRSGPIVLGEVHQPFPQNNYRGTLQTLRFTPADNVVTLYYGLTDSLLTFNLKLYRSRYMENNYREIKTNAVYTNLKGRIVAVVDDRTVTKGMAYSYVAVPYDQLGNMGRPSDTINIYNLSKVADLGYISGFSAVADKEKRGVTLSWKVDTDLYIHGYKVYRSKDYENGYTLVATLPQGTTTWFDLDIDPAEPYFYFVSMDNGFGHTIPSARIPVILEGNRPNTLPPQNVTATLNKNIVTLTFTSISPDIKSYQIFRGEGYTGELTLIASFSAPEPAGLPVTFVDTLARSTTPQTYSYAVADVNSSYNISPMSERASIQYSGGVLPIPSRLQAQLRGDRIFVVWDDVSEQNAFVMGYNVWRSTVDSEGVTVEKPQIVATLLYNQNSYLDTLLTPGSHYRYVLESVGPNDEKSNQSMHVGIIVPQQLPLPPGQVSAFASDKFISLRWDSPIDPSIKSIRIYRATAGAKATLLKELPTDQSTYQDRTAQKGVMYLYYVVTVNERGQESKMALDEPVSARIRK